LFLSLLYCTRTVKAAKSGRTAKPPAQPSNAMGDDGTAAAVAAAATSSAAAAVDRGSSGADQAAGGGGRVVPRSDDDDDDVGGDGAAARHQQPEPHKQQPPEENGNRSGGNDSVLSRVWDRMSPGRCLFASGSGDDDLDRTTTAAAAAAASAVDDGGGGGMLLGAAACAAADDGTAGASSLLAELVLVRDEIAEVAGLDGCNYGGDRFDGTADAIIINNNSKASAPTAFDRDAGAVLRDLAASCSHHRQPHHGGDAKKRAAALQRLYQLTNRERHHNRMPLMCRRSVAAAEAAATTSSLPSHNNNDYNCDIVIRALLPCLDTSPAAEAGGGGGISVRDRRKALLILANLSVPYENKLAIIMHSVAAAAATATAEEGGRTEQKTGDDGNNNKNCDDNDASSRRDDDLISALLRIIVHDTVSSSSWIRLQSNAAAGNRGNDDDTNTGAAATTAFDDEEAQPPPSSSSCCCTHLAAAILYNLSLVEQQRAQQRPPVSQISSTKADADHRQVHRDNGGGDENKKLLLLWECLHIPKQQRREEAGAGNGREQDKMADATAPSETSCLKILERMLIDYVPLVVAEQQLNTRQHRKSPSSVQYEAVRWSIGIVRNLIASCPGNAALVASFTRIPELAATCFASSRRDLSYWSRDSMEESCLMLWVHLVSLLLVAPSPSLIIDDDDNELNDDAGDAVVASSVPVSTNISEGTRQSLERSYRTILRPALLRLRGQGGIHEVRANAILHQMSSIVGLSSSSAVKSEEETNPPASLAELGDASTVEEKKV